MLFRQKIQSYKLIGLIFGIAIPLFCSFVFLFVGVVKDDFDAYAFSVMCFVATIIIGLSCSIYLQWFDVYEDCIVVRNIFGVVNRVEFSKVHYVLKKQLPVFTRDRGAMHYVFVDGRPTKRKGITYPYNSDNHKNITVRIPVTPELTAFLETKALAITEEPSKKE